MKEKLLFMFVLAPVLAFGSVEFSKQKVKVGNAIVTVEVADTEQKRAQGLMFRKKLTPDHGMLFIFPDEGPRGFWMKNTLIPLSIGYFDKAKRLVTILDMEPQPNAPDFDLKIYVSGSPAQYALEVTKGWFEKQKLKVGDQLHLSIK